MEKTAYVIGTFFAIPSILGALGLLGIQISAADYEASGEAENIGQFWFFFRWVIIFWTIGQLTPLLSLLSFWLANWSSGLAPIFPWAILLLSGISGLFLGGLGLMSGLLVILFCLSSENLAFWK